MKCNRCHINNATIHIEGVGEFCLECHNKFIVETYGVEQLETYTKQISVFDVDGIIHTFEISNVLMPMYSTWRAEEIGGGYIFEVMVDLEDEQLEALRHLHQKILIGIGYKSLEVFPDKPTITNAIHRDGKQFGLRTVGTGRIDYDSKTRKTVFYIDGKKVTLDEFGLMLTSMEGFIFDYQMRDITDEVIGKDMILRHVNISKNRIYDNFEKTLQWFLTDNTLTIDRVDGCIEALYERIDELELVFNYGDIAVAKELGNRMIERLMTIESDSEAFPMELVEDIIRIIGH